MRKITQIRLSGIILLATFFLAYKFHPVVNSKINGIVFVLSNNHTGITAGYISSFNRLSALVSILLMVFQSVLAPLSTKSIIDANAQIFGNVFGGIISSVGLTIGAVACYALWRFLFGWIPFPTKNMEMKRGQWELPVHVLCRILLFPIYDYCSYLLGLFKINYLQFILVCIFTSVLQVLVYLHFGMA